MVDIHCHLADSRYDEAEIEEIVERAGKSGVRMISNGTGLKNSKRTVEIAEKYTEVWAAVGLAYDRTSENWDGITRELIEMSKSKKVVAIGEAGLDFYQGISEDLKEYQVKLLQAHIEAAKQTGLPLQIHNRNADIELLQLLEKVQSKVVMHCFTRGIEFMQECIQRGWYISIGGLVTYKNNKRMEKVARLVPEEKLLLETDAPYSTPEPIKETKNEPKNVRIVADKLAQIREVDVLRIEEITSNNVAELFKI